MEAVELARVVLEALIMVVLWMQRRHGQELTRVAAKIDETNGRVCHAERILQDGSSKA